LPVFVPDSSVDVDPVRVHVDPVTQVILGYEVLVSGLDFETEPQSVFVPGADEELPALAASVPTLGLVSETCLLAGVSTAPIPVVIPESVLSTPGAIVDVPRIGLDVLGKTETVPGQQIELPGRTIVLPGLEAVVPGQELGTPPGAVAVEVDATETQTSQFLAP
jgi:hypothetical protein